MSTAFTSGANYAHKLYDFTEMIERLIRNAMTQYRDNQEFKRFIETLQQTDPKHPTINQENATFYDVTGLGHKELQSILKQCNIPNFAFVDSPNTASPGGQIDAHPTILAVPSQYEKQVNLLFAQHHSLLVQPGEYVSTDTIDKMIANAINTPSPMAVNSILAGTALTKTFEGGRWMPLAEKMQDAGIPYAIVKNSHDNTTSIIFAQTYAFQVYKMDKDIELTKNPAELSYADFMNKHCGHNIVEHTDLTPAQMNDIRRALCGSCAGYNVEPKGNGTFTLRYSIEKAPLITPCVISAIIKTNGANRDAIEAQADYITHQAENARTNVVNKQNLVICDATREDRIYTVDDKGLTGPDGKLMIRRNDPKFADTVHATVSRMEAPIVKSFPMNEQPTASAISKLEIVKAKEAYAAACPTDAGLMAAQIAFLKASTLLSQPGASVERVFKDTANSCLVLADRIEEEFKRAAPAENKGKIDLADLLQKYGLPGDRVPEAVIGFEEMCREKKNPDELAKFAENLRTIANVFNGQIKVNKVTGDKCSVNDIGNILDGPISGGQDPVPNRGDQAPGSDGNMNNILDCYDPDPKDTDDTPLLGGDI